MIRERLFRTIFAGLLTGLVAALLMTLVMALLRYSLGFASTFEMFGDRFAPLLPVDLFLRLQGILGGYDQMKGLGVGSVIAGQIIVGCTGGALYALVVERDPARRRAPGITRRGILFVALVVGLAWLGTLALLRPVLDTNFRGSPPGPASVMTVLALLFSFVVFGLTLVLVYRAITRSESSDEGASAPAGGRLIGRRAFLAGVAGLGFALVSGELFRRLFDRATFSYDGLTYGGPGLQAITPNDQFYVVTKNVVDPLVERSAWRLGVTGLVDDPKTYTFEQIASMPSVEQETTLSCISNPVGGELMSNAMWKGVPLRDLIEASSPREGVVEVVLHAVDGYTDTFSFEKALDPTTLVAYEMNGEPLPDRHGYPARILVPGLFGEKNVKWVTRIELVDHDAKGFYETQGWGPNFVQPTRSRFDAPDFARPLRAGQTVGLLGIAYGGDRGVSKVEVSTDDGRSWREARIDHQGSKLAWSVWSHDWRPEGPGEYRLVVRATDGEGELQTSEVRRVGSGMGATGLHKVTARVEA
ncbi:molybdopterin-dependent oxidoreductase [Rubrobacter marinus]|uniref:Molybdopterin-dependent oxidoreductase n=1 Tax=Rubrobacter marinus TaxID=2653852 RepID=A0A6G8PSK9_9ACTN|nr:molybdopterin-dependent oxidoreductase [Rubrobacter marinus]QIN77469.1 molybdopterin-dependent oxidoreductase [Rubrobacter marinus]